MVWLILTAGQWPFRRVNIMCDEYLLRPVKTNFPPLSNLAALSQVTPMVLRFSTCYETHC
jgi:hypothetical protein